MLQPQRAMDDMSEAATLISRLGRKVVGRASRRVHRNLGRWLHSNVTPTMMEHRPDFHYHFDGFPEFKAMAAAWMRGNIDNNSGDFARLYMFYLNVKLVLDDRVPGDFVELGVYKGNSAFVLATFGRQHGRTTYLYDTFEGFDRRDLTEIDARQAVQFTDTSLEDVRSLVGTEGVVYVPGYFPQSLATTQAPTQIAVAHIDCDLYAPMLAGLETFYPRVSPGGVLFLHDYASGFWPGAKRAVDEFLADKPEQPVIIPDKSGTAVIRKCA